MSDGFSANVDDGLVVIKIPTRVDVTNAQGLVDIVKSHMGQHGDHFVLDLRETEALDSTALGAVVSLYKTLRVGEGDLVLTGADEGIRRILALTRLDRVLESHPDIASVREKLAKAA